MSVRLLRTVSDMGRKLWTGVAQVNRNRGVGLGMDRNSSHPEVDSGENTSEEWIGMTSINCLGHCRWRASRVVVTGAASGMGRATAVVLAELGAAVVAVDRAPMEG